MRVLLLLLAFCLSACNSTPTPTEDASSLRIVDTHIHIYDTARPQGVPWPPATDKEIYSPHLPADFAAVARRNHVSAVVIVEASHLLEDNQWLLDVTKDQPLFVAVVGNLTPGDADFEANLERFSKDKRFVGIRPRGVEKVDLTEEHRIADLRKLAAKGLSLDLLTFRASLSQIDVIARKVPDLKIVINHLASARVDGSAPDAKWAMELAAVALHKNVYCKISGLSQQSVKKPAPMELSYYQPTLDLIWQAFGEDRLIFASNWPVTKMGGDYEGELRMTKEFIEPKGKAATEKLFWKNANKVYGLGLK